MGERRFNSEPKKYLEFGLLPCSNWEKFIFIHEKLIKSPEAETKQPENTQKIPRSMRAAA